MELLFSVKHKIDSEGRFHIGDFEYGEIDEFTTFFYWDAMVEKILIECAKRKESRDMEIERNAKKYLMRVIYNNENEWNLCYKVFSLHS